jgi:hypothetical protein
MAMYVYGTAGEPRGFLFETTIYHLDGTPLGRLAGSRVHRFDGSYVGEWCHQMVVARSDARPRRIPPVAAPRILPPVATGSSRRPVADYRNFEDAFDLLLESSPSGGQLPEAAE